MQNELKEKQKNTDTDAAHRSATVTPTDHKRLIKHFDGKNAL